MSHANFGSIVKNFDGDFTICLTLVELQLYRLPVNVRISVIIYLNPATFYAFLFKIVMQFPNMTLSDL